MVKPPFCIPTPRILPPDFARPSFLRRSTRRKPLQASLVRPGAPRYYVKQPLLLDGSSDLKGISESFLTIKHMGIELIYNWSMMIGWWLYGIKMDETTQSGIIGIHCEDPY